MQLRRPPALSPDEACAQAATGSVRLLDLRTRTERTRYGAPPGSRRVSLLRHVLWPQGAGAVYLCQHAVRSKLTGWRGAAEVAGGWVAWKCQDLPVQD